MKPLTRYLKPHYLLVLVALFFVLLYVVFLLTGGAEESSGRRNSFERDGTGYFYFFQLFQQMHYTVKRWYEPQLPRGTGNLLVYWDYYPRDQVNLDGIMKWVKRGNVLVIAGIHQSSDPIFNRPLRVGPSSSFQASDDRDYAFSFSYSGYLEEQPDDQVLLRSESGALVISRPVGEGVVCLFVDNTLFINQYFTNPDHAIFLNQVLNPYFERTMYIYEYGSGVSRVQNPVWILFQGHLLFLTLHLLLLGLIFVAWQSRRFGKPHHAELFKRRSLSVHLAAVGNFYQKAKALHIVETLMRKYFIRRTKQLLNIKTKITSTELVAKLAAYTGENRETLITLLEKPTGQPEKALLQKRRDMFRVFSYIKNYKRR